MKLIDILSVIPMTQPIRIHESTCLSPNTALIPLTYKNTILEGIYNLGDEKVFYVGAQVVDGIPYVVISLDRTEGQAVAASAGDEARATGEQAPPAESGVR